MELRAQYSVIFIWLITIPSTLGQDVTVTTNVGTIIGELYHGIFNATPFTVSQFLAIPFAEPPIGERRFQKPVKKAPFTEPLTAKSMPSACIQISGVMPGIKIPEKISEDCLYLNILVPGDTISVSNRKAVLVWIYGGGFQVGSQDIYTSPTFAGLNDVILVTLNYRVSVYGFLSTGERHMTGNQGLHDQHMAIKWVHDHIENFGGDPNRVTIFGVSAGGASVVYQALYEGNQGMFKRVIAQSGSANSEWALSRSPQMDFDQFVNRTDCKVGTLPTVIKCLRNKTTDEIQAVIGDLSFSPVYDRDFVKMHPADIFRNETEQASEILKSFGKLDFIFGVTSDEGGYFIKFIDYTMSPQGAATNPSDGYSLEAFETVGIPVLVSINPSIYLTNALKRSILHAYVDWQDTSNKTLMRQKAIDLLSDVNFNADLIHAADVHSSIGETGRTFFYVYDHQLSTNPSNRGYDGAAHSEELEVVFGLDMATDDIPGSLDDPATLLPAHEILFSKQVMEYWTNFAKTGLVVCYVH